MISVGPVNSLYNTVIDIILLNLSDLEYLFVDNFCIG